ncbi:hypothetical protein P9139_02745 [Curtobacterium flaccumfaciens]|nr:hypothetical protein P9139_02745 [Curtobacterium flaccumfaciens]
MNNVEHSVLQSGSALGRPLEILVDMPIASMWYLTSSNQLPLAFDAAPFSPSRGTVERRSK